MSAPSDPVVIRHPALPDLAPITIARSALPAHLARKWVEVKSSVARAAVEAPAPTEGDNPKETS